MPEMNFRKLAALTNSEFTYSACISFTKNKEKKQKFKETQDSLYIYQNKLGKACFQHDMTYEKI